MAETDDSCQLDFTDIVPVSKDTVDSCSSECLHGDSFAEVKEHLVDFVEQDPDDVCCFIFIHFTSTAEELETEGMPEAETMGAC